MSNAMLWVNYKGDKPSYQTPGSAGCDLRSTVDLEIPPGRWAAVPTGVFLAIPFGFMGLVCPRSGLAASSGVTVLNAPGIIDSDYRGEVKVLLMNHSHEVFFAKTGDRIAQLIFSPVIQATLLNVDELSQTSRGERGFGSTGVK